MWLFLGRPSPQHYMASLLLVLLALVIRGKDQATQIAIAAMEGTGVGRCWLGSCSSGRCPISRVKKVLSPLLVSSGLQNVETVWATGHTGVILPDQVLIRLLALHKSRRGVAELCCG